MAIRFAKQNGNWSSASTWDGGLTIPTTGDDVYFNGFRVIIDQNINVNSLRSQTNPYGLSDSLIPTMINNTTPSGVAFASVNNTDAFNAFNRSDGSYWIGNSNGTGFLGYQFTTTKIVRRYSWNINGFGGTNQRPRNWTFEGSNDGVNYVILHTVTANPTSSIYFSPDIGNTTPYLYYMINISATQLTSNPYINQLDMSEVAQVGNGYGTGGGGDLTTNVTITSPIMYSQQSRLFQCSTGLITVNFIGNLFSSSSNYPANDGQILYNTASSTFNFTGNANLLSSGGNGAWDIYSAVAGSVVNFVGDVTRLAGPNQQIGFFNGNSLNFTGVMNNNPAAGSTSVISIVNNCNFVGNLISSTINGVPTFTSNVLTLFSGNIITMADYFPVTGRIKMLSSSQNSILFQTQNSLVTQTLYTPGVNTGHPATTNVRTGITYGPTNNLTGTCAVPPAGAVSLGVPVDNTTGTAYLSGNDISAAVWDTQTTSLSATGSIGERLKNASTVDTTAATVAAYDI